MFVLAGKLLHCLFEFFMCLNMVDVVRVSEGIHEFFFNIKVGFCVLDQTFQDFPDQLSAGVSVN